MKLTWIKFRIHLDTNITVWDYVPVPDIDIFNEKDAEKYLRDQGILPDQHPRYRGVETESVARPPDEVLEKYITQITAGVRHNIKMLKALRKIRKLN